MQIILRLLGMGGNMRRLAYAQTLEEQRAAWESAWFIRFLRGAPALLVRVFIKLLSLIFFNRIVLWCAVASSSSVTSSLMLICARWPNH